MSTLRLTGLLILIFSLRASPEQPSFVVRRGPVKVGYYFIAPGKKPRIEYGVVTDIDLLQIATEYFGVISR
jgi:hypothetical protein